MSVKRERELFMRVVKLEHALWEAIRESGEDNITVILGALATLIKRTSEYSMTAEAKGTANNAETPKE